MNKELVNQIGTLTEDNLIGGLEPKALTTGVSVASGQGILKRGTVLGFVEEKDLTVVGSAVAEGKERTASFILARDVDTGTKTGTPVSAVAYQTGMFNRNALTVAEGYTLTAKDEHALRTGGIFLTDSVN